MFSGTPHLIKPSALEWASWARLGSLCRPSMNETAAKWNFLGKNNEVAHHYQDAWGRVELSESQLADAFTEAVKQVSWYDEKSNWFLQGFV